MSNRGTREAFIVRDFNDAGTNARYTAGKIVQIEHGSFANYKDAGLVRAPTDAEKKASSAPEQKAAS